MPGTADKKVENPYAPPGNHQRYWDMWSLHCERGRQLWKLQTPESAEPDLQKAAEAFVFDKSLNANSGDRLYRYLCQRSVDDGPDIDNNGFAQPRDSADEEALARAVGFYESLQQADGHWPGDYGGPLFLLPGLLVASHVTGFTFPAMHSTLMAQYMLNHQNPDGGWGLHIEGASTMFGTVMQYVALRILGLKTEESALSKARSWILENGGATGIPPWGKFYLALLGVYSWDGCDSLLPEMWLLPKSFPFHPSRYWCHARMVYLPMSYCYGHRITAKESALTRELREELYTKPYHSIDWGAARATICERDVFSRPSRILSLLNKWLINPYERLHNARLRRKALQFSLEYIDAEDEQTSYVDIGPVNQVINSICAWHAYGPDSHQFRQHTERWFDYLWLAEDGMKMNGYNGSQLWDTAFAVQAILEGAPDLVKPDTIKRAYTFLEQSQVREDVSKKERFFRHSSKGGWPFSTYDHGWPISDCTAEGLGAVLAMHTSGLIEQGDQLVDRERMCEAVDLILSFQNNDGGWATYENTRGPAWLEVLNPSGVFGDIMIDYSYTECTSACMRALHEFSHFFPEYQEERVRKALDSGARFLRQKQESDGPWIGSWGVCFTYGTWFGIEGLISGGISADDRAIKQACSFLLGKQNSDGGWGESFESCVRKVYIPAESNVVNTSWAILALMAAGCRDVEAIERGIDFIRDRQLSNGDWPQEAISGVFNANCMITYTAYRNVFPIWALGRYRRLYKQH